MQSKGLPGLEGEARKDSLTRNLGGPIRILALGDRERSHGGAIIRGRNNRCREYITADLV